tara:strand:+ start:2514 stop:4019 length:1506 start_codon:yes stop_codon:yes gene_type:complete
MLATIGPIDTTIIVIYFAVIVGMGLFISRKQDSTEEYFLGRRNMNWLIVGISIQASLMSTISYLSVPGEQIKNGLMCHASFVGMFPAIFVINYLLLPYFLRMRITTIYELLEHRFNLAVRMVGVAVFLLLRIIWMGLVVYTASFALTAITGWELWAIIVGVAIVGTVYTWLGGMRAVIWTDVVQWFVLFGGCLFCIGYVMYAQSTGPADWWRAAQEVSYEHQPLFDWDPRVRITAMGLIIQTFFAKICLHGSDQVAVQRYLSTPSASAAAKSFLSYVGCALALTIVTAILGLALTSYAEYGPDGAQWSGPSDADEVFPWFIAHSLPVGVRGLVVAGLLAAAMSSIDSGINSLSAVVTVDFYERFFRKDDDDRPALWVAKLVTLLAGMLSVVMAFVMQLIQGNLYEVMNKSTGGLPGTLGMIVLAAVLLPRCGPAAVLAGAAVSMICGWLITYSPELFGPQWGISFMWIIPGGCVSGLLVAGVLSVLFPTKPDDRWKPSESK